MAHDDQGVNMEVPSHCLVDSLEEHEGERRLGFLYREWMGPLGLPLEDTRPGADDFG